VRKLPAVLILIAMNTGALWGMALQYQGLALPPNEIFDVLTEYAQDDNYAALARSLNYLQPLLQALRLETGEDPKQDLEAAIAGKDHERTIAAVRRLIFLDMSVNMEAGIKKESVSEKKEFVLMANIDYAYLASFVRSKEKGADLNIKSALKSAYRSSDAESVSRSIQKALNLVGPLFSKEKHDSPKIQPTP
jgi:hypothetical protein